MHNREFWAKHVEGWRESGQIAREYAASEVLSAGQMDRRFDLELTDGKRIRIPSSFEADALRRLLNVLEGAA